MKLFTAGGFLYSSVMAQRADGSNGDYEAMDYVAMFPEAENWKYSGNMNVGWDPMVTAIATTYDGGKAMAGFGKYTGTMYQSWVLKMWGNVGTKKCGSPSVISGYVNMVFGLNSAVTSEALCSSSTDAKVQWAWSTSPTAGFGASTNSSYVILTACEEWKFGGGTGTGQDPYVIVMGGSTAGNAASWGLLGMSMWANFISMDGEDKVADCTGCDKIKSFNYEVVYKASNVVFFKADDTNVGKSGMLISNHCWTASIGRPDAAADKRAAVGGITGSVNSCCKIAVDGYSLSGAMVIGIVSNNMTSMLDAAALKILEEVGNAAPYNGDMGMWVGDTTLKAINQGSPTTVLVDNAGGNEAWWLVTANEWFQNSGCFAALVGSAISGTIGADMARATYGQLWSMWAFMADDGT